MESSHVLREHFALECGPLDENLSFGVICAHNLLGWSSELLLTYGFVGTTELHASRSSLCLSPPCSTYINPKISCVVY